MVVVYPNVGTGPQVDAAAGAPCGQTTELSTEQVIGDIVPVVEVICRRAEHRIGFAGCVLQVITELEPAKSTVHVQSQFAALRAIPRSAGACRAADARVARV